MQYFLRVRFMRTSEVDMLMSHIENHALGMLITYIRLDSLDCGSGRSKRKRSSYCQLKSACVGIAIVQYESIYCAES